MSVYAQNFGNWQIFFASLLVFAVIAVSRALKLGMEKDLFIAGIRTTVQLIAVGSVLRWILHADTLLSNVGILAVMTLIAAQAIASRVRSQSWKTFFAACIALVGSIWVLGAFSLLVFIESQALVQSAFFIPFMGVIMGNTLSSISLTFVGAERVRKESFTEIENFKSLGATSLEACRRLYGEVLRTALNPNLNAMNVVGLVSLPGVMAGQVLGGVEPLSAARFQILVMFLILASSMIGGLISLYLDFRLCMPQWMIERTAPWGLQVEVGERIVLSGASGVGKSRLLKSLVGLDDVKIRDESKDKSSPQFFSDRPLANTFYLPQRPYFIPGTVEENLKWPFQFGVYKTKAYEPDFIKRLLNSFGLSEALLEKNATTLSGGEAQVVHLIRCLQFKPKVLLLDEPCSSMDAGRTQLVEEFLINWVKEENDRALIMITHQKDQMQRFATRVLCLKDRALTSLHQ